MKAVYKFILLGLSVLAVVLQGSAQAQTLTTLYSFTGGSDGGWPNGPLVMDASGNYYGTTTWTGNGLGSGTVFKFRAGHLTTLFTFNGGDGAHSTAGVVLDKGGNLYGTTQNGGDSNSGVVFRLDAKRNETVLHYFTGNPDGYWPWGAVLRDAKDNLFGTTVYGGADPCFDNIDCGTVFEIDEKGQESILYNFAGSPDGFEPTSALISDATGNLYGTATKGGKNCFGAPIYGCGIIYKLTPDSGGNWTETILHNFSQGKDGWQPVASALIQDDKGSFYGVASLEGNSDPACGSNGCGVIYKLTADGQYTVLYRFKAAKTYKDGLFPFGQLLLDKQGDLYGTAGGGIGPRGGYGIIYKLSKAGKMTVLHRFEGTDGTGPNSLIWDKEGNLLGTAQTGGASNWGEIFRLSLK